MSKQITNNKLKELEGFINVQNFEDGMKLKLIQDINSVVRSSIRESKKLNK